MARSALSVLMVRSRALARRTGTLSRAISATCWSVALSRSQRTSTMPAHAPGLRSNKAMTSRRSRIASVHEVMARASAVRSFPSSMAISPKYSFSCRIASTISRPSVDGTLMRTSPPSTAIMLLPDDPMRKMVSPASKRRTRARASNVSFSTAERPRNNVHWANDWRAMSSEVRSIADTALVMTSRLM